MALPKTQKSKPPRKSSLQDAALDALAVEADFLDRQGSEQRASKALQPGRLSSAPERDLGKRVQEMRESRRMTQGELSQLTLSLDDEEKGISRPVISLYESGTNRPSPKEIRLLCEALQATPNFLIYGDEEPFHTLNNYERLGTIGRGSDPEVYAWVALVMSKIHHNHYDAVMKLVLDLARAWDKTFDQGLQEEANKKLLKMASELTAMLEKRKVLAASDPVKKKF